VADSTITVNSSAFNSITLAAEGNITINRDPSFTSGSTYFFTVAAGKTFTLGDSSGTLILDGGKNDMLSGSSLVYVGTSGVQLNIKGNTTLQNNSNFSNGAAVYFNSSGGTFTMNGGTISGNAVTGSGNIGGGVYVSAGNFIMSGGAVISGNTAYADGGGVAFEGGGTFTMNGGTISGNNVSDATGRGGGVYLASTFIMAGGTIYGSGAGTPLANTASTGASLARDPVSTVVTYGNNISILSGTDMSTNSTIYGGSPGHTAP
jgi:hypothetical protein